MLEINSVLRRLNIVRVQAPLTSYWAIGPRGLLVGDWLILVLVMGPDEFVPTLAGENISQISSSEWHVCYCSEASKRNEQSPDSSSTQCIMQLQQGTTFEQGWDKGEFWALRAGRLGVIRDLGACRGMKRGEELQPSGPLSCCDRRHSSSRGPRELQNLGGNGQSGPRHRVSFSGPDLFLSDLIQF